MIFAQTWLMVLPIAIQLTELEQRFEQEKNLISELLEQRRQSQDVSNI